MAGMIRRDTVLGRLVLGPILGLAATGDVQAAHGLRDSVGGRPSYTSSGAGCRVANPSYAVHFSAVQEGPGTHDRSRFENFCGELPGIGKTYLSIDFASRDLRAMPVALHLVEEGSPSPANADGHTRKRSLLEVPAKIYGSGTAVVAVEFTHPGDYALIATFGEIGAFGHDRLRIPFSVKRATLPVISFRYRDFAAAVALTFFVVMSGVGYRVYRSYNPKMLPGTAASSLARAAGNMTRRGT